MDNFTHVTLLSNSSLKYYPNNSLSRFTVKLPNVINLDSNEKWYVGLTSVAHTVVRTKETFPPKMMIKLTVRTGWTNEKLINLLNAAPSFYESIKDKKFFDRYRKNTEINTFTYIKKDNRPFIQFTVLEKVNVTVLSGVQYTPNELFDTIFSQIERKRWAEFIKSIKSDIEKFQLTTAVQTRIQELKENYIEEIIEIRDIPYPMYICFYCDIIKPRIIGDTSVRCLFMDPFRIVSDKSIPRAYHIDNIQYCLVEKHSISEINILIADEHGDQVYFEDDLFMTSLVLHFRKGI